MFKQKVKMWMSTACPSPCKLCKTPSTGGRAHISGDT